MLPRQRTRYGSALRTLGRVRSTALIQSLPRWNHLRPRLGRGDWWLRAVPYVVVSHTVVLSVLYARPGRVALWTWYAGPAVLAIIVGVLLVGSLVSAQRWRRGVNRWHVVGYCGLLVVIATLPIYDAYPSSYDNRESQATFRLPLDAPVKVAWGGATSDVNYHVYMPDQRWAYDLLVVRDGTTFRADGSRLSDYYSYGLSVLAPASGRVFAAHDGEREVEIGARRWALAGLGNYVGIEVAPNEYLFGGHFQPDSVTVQVGDDVRAGQQIGRVGNSGNSSEPHIHLHLQDTPRPYLGEGIPFSFSQYEHRGRLIERGMPRGGRRNGRYSGDTVAHVPKRSAGCRGSDPFGPLRPRQ